MTEAGIVEDLSACHDMLAELGIESRPWFRAPQGVLSHHDLDMTAAIKRAGYRHIHWHALGEDWQPGANPDGIAAQISEGVRDRWPRPAIVLLHSWPDSAPGALRLVLDRLERGGASFLTVDELGWRHAVAGRAREAVTRRKAG
jgi:peptidoglycan/xylan/chitin deacetylase (PgdA/CDA1 family)